MNLTSTPRLLDGSVTAEGLPDEPVAFYEAGSFFGELSHGV
jgi:hypothetical protein